MMYRQGNSATGTRARVDRVRAEYPDQLDYSGVAHVPNGVTSFVARFVACGRGRAGR